MGQACLTLARFYQQAEFSSRSSKVMSSNPSNLLSIQFKNVLKSDPWLPSHFILNTDLKLLFNFCHRLPYCTHNFYRCSCSLSVIAVCFSCYSSWVPPKGVFLKLMKMSSTPIFFLLSLPFPLSFCWSWHSGLWPEIICSFSTSSYQFGFLIL